MKSNFMLQYSGLYSVMDARDHFKNKASSKIMSSRLIFKRILQVIIVVLCFTQCSFTQTEEITEDNYLKVDNAIWTEYEQEMEKISEYLEKHPEKKDSLTAAANRVYAIASKRNIEAAIKFAAVPSGLQQLYTVRLDISKDTIYSVLKNLPDSMQTSPYGKSLLYHINSEQISEGSRYYDFQAVDTEGRNFTLSSFESKNILLLYGGLGCMGEHGREYLNKIYRETSRDNFEIVVYCMSSNLENLQQERTRYSVDFILVSDFLQDHTPMKILYGAQELPTCFFINQEGVVVMKTVGLYQEQVNELIIVQ